MLAKYYANNLMGNNARVLILLYLCLGTKSGIQKMRDKKYSNNADIWFIIISNID